MGATAVVLLQETMMTYNKLFSLAQSIMFWTFVIIKWKGTLLVDWSWWWCLFPGVPELCLVLQHFGLL
jgi:hypothetical protein